MSLDMGTADLDFPLHAIVNDGFMTIFFLVAFAIIDDIGAILVIALFYTQLLAVAYLEYALLCVLLLLVCNASVLAGVLGFLWLRFVH